MLLIKVDVTFVYWRTNWGQDEESTDQTEVTLVELTRSICFRGFSFFSFTYGSWMKRALMVYPLYYFFLKRHILMN